MEHALLKMARQLDALDEASLLALWEKYADLVSQFEPTKRWEEAVLVLSFIQSKRWKNQLFNYHWAAQARPGTHAEPSMPPLFAETEESIVFPEKAHKGKVLRFQPKRRASQDEIDALLGKAGKTDSPS